MNTGEPPGRTHDVEPIEGTSPSASKKLPRIAFAATVPDLTRLQEQLSVAVHDALWIPLETGGHRVSMATHSTMVLRDKANGTANVIVTLTPREGTETLVRQTIGDLMKEFARTMNGTLHGEFSGEEQLGELIRGKIPAKDIAVTSTDETEQLA